MSRLSRDEWLAGAFRVLAERGPGAMGISVLSKALGVTKGSFYWHFDSRQALLDAMFSSWEAKGTARIIEVVDAHSEDPAVRLHHLAVLVFGDADRYDAIEANLRSLARGNAAALAAVDRVDARRLEYVTQLLRAAGVPRAAARSAGGGVLSSAHWRVRLARGRR